MVDHARTPGIKRPSRTDEAAAFLIQRTARLLRVLFLRLIQEQRPDLTPEMWHVLSRLLARDGVTHSELAESTFRDRPNISRIVAGLEERGLVAREIDHEDRRRSRVHLTSAGMALLRETGPLAAQTRDRLYEGLTREQIATMRSVLRRMEGNALAYLEDVEARGAAG